MSVSPDSQMMLVHILPSVCLAIRRDYSSCDPMILQDAVATAAERFLLRAPPHVQHSREASRQWILQTAIREIHRELRLASRFVKQDIANDTLNDLRGRMASDATAEESILREVLEHRLGPSIAETIWLREVERCSTRDIAEMQRISITAVKARIERARKVLRAMFRAHRERQNG